MTTPDAVTLAKRKRGRPRSFVTVDVLDRSITVFWRHGFNNVTTRWLESEIGISQSSIYNAFGSKEGLFNQVVDLYQARFRATVLARLDQEAPDRDDLIRTIVDIIAWVGQPEHPGCLVLNYGGETSDGHHLVVAYRQLLRDLFQPAIRSFTPDEQLATLRTDLLIVSVLGMISSANCGATADELQRIGDGVIRQMQDW